jgi:hypothetical protein
LALCAALFTVQLAAASSSHAASDYDNVFHNVGELKLKYGSSYDEDVSTTYMAKYQASCTKDAYNFMHHIMTSDGGMWFVRQNKSIWAAGIGEVDYITIFFSENPNAKISYRDFGSVKGFFISEDDEFYQLSIWPAAMMNQGAPDQVRCQDVPTPMSPTGNTALLDPTYVWVNNFPIVYPDGYEGEIPQSEYTPPAPPTTLYEGTVDCGTQDTPQAMAIYQPGNNGAATLTPLSPGVAKWSYNLTSDPYSFNVYCGGELASSSAPVSPAPPTSNMWMCDLYGDPSHYCVLS